MRNICKICVLCAFLGVAVSAQEGNGVFVGLEAGAGEQKITLTVANTAQTQQGTAILFGGKLGYKHFFLDWIGIRGYVGVDYAETKSGSGNDSVNKNPYLANYIHRECRCVAKLLQQRKCRYWRVCRSWNRRTNRQR